MKAPKLPGACINIISQNGKGAKFGTSLWRSPGSPLLKPELAAQACVPIIPYSPKDGAPTPSG